jgi:hypothetical protein
MRKVNKQPDPRATLQKLLVESVAVRLELRNDPVLLHLLDSTVDLIKWIIAASGSRIG